MGEGTEGRRQIVGLRWTAYWERVESGIVRP
jgi:hypothetical protein